MSEQMDVWPISVSLLLGAGCAVLTAAAGDWHPHDGHRHRRVVAPAAAGPWRHRLRGVLLLVGYVASIVLMFLPP